MLKVAVPIFFFFDREKNMNMFYFENKNGARLRKEAQYG